jgi:hypothetical protein
MALESHVNFGEVEEGRIDRYRVDIVTEPDRNVGRAEIVAAKIYTRTRSEHRECPTVVREAFADSPMIFPESMKESARWDVELAGGLQGLDVHRGLQRKLRRLIGLVTHAVLLREEVNVEGVLVPDQWRMMSGEVISDAK